MINLTVELDLKHDDLLTQVKKGISILFNEKNEISQLAPNNLKKYACKTYVDDVRLWNRSKKNVRT